MKNDILCRFFLCLYHIIHKYTLLGGYMNKYNGLSDEEVFENRKQYGSNKIIMGPKDSLIKIVISSFGDPIIRILLIALAIKVFFFMQKFDWFENIGILITIIMASFISSASEYGSEKAFNLLLKESQKLKCIVKRNNKNCEVFIDDLVYGDIVYLESGNKVPADGTIIDGSISLDESSLNGETKENNKKVNDNVLKGSVVINGKAVMKVSAVGVNTFYGKLTEELKEKTPNSPLKIRLLGLAKFISKIGYIGAGITFLSYLLLNGLTIANTVYALTLSVTIIIVCVPEGLPMMVTLVLSSNMKKMLKDNVLVRKLMGIETAGSLNVLFCDKTGTLTKGELEVTNFVSGSLKEYSYQDLIKSPLSKIVKISCTINNSSFFEDNNIIGGNITDKAILKFIKKNNVNYSKIGEIPFNSKNKYSVVKIQDKERINLVKGAPEILLKECKHYYTDTMAKEKININEYLKINKYLNKQALDGKRIIALVTNNNIDMNNFHNSCLVGFMLIKDEVRNNVKESIELVKKAGVNTIMLTGDNKETATSIAKELNLLDNNSIVLTSHELNLLSDEEVEKQIKNIKVISRMLPSDKSRLVRICQNLNLVVGMTGDGVNDAPALKKADVGFSMGSGNEVAKEASDIVILDNNFLSITKAILYGRTIFKSIRKFVMLQLTINFCALSLSIIGPYLGIDTPITIMQMLWINMVMDTLAGLAFAFEPPLKKYMNEKPKAKNEPILNKYMYYQILFMGLFSSLICLLFIKCPIFLKLYRDSNSLMAAFFGLFIFIDIFNSLNAHTSNLNVFNNILKNKVFVSILSFIVIIQIIMIYYGGKLFRTVPLNLSELAIMIMWASLVLPFSVLLKLYLKNKNIKNGV